MASDVPFAILGIDHIVLRTRNHKEMLDFYVNVLGCTIERTVQDVGLIQLRAGLALIDLIEGLAFDLETSRLDHFCLAVGDFDGERLSQYLRSRGCEPEPLATRYGASGFGPSLYLKDPDGNGIELKGLPAASHCVVPERDHRMRRPPR